MYLSPHFPGLIQVLVHWACAKISAGSDSPDASLHRALEEKLRGRSDIRYAVIAMHAQAVGRNSLATLLLELEPCASQQVLTSYAALLYNCNALQSYNLIEFLLNQVPACRSDRVSSTLIIKGEQRMNTLK